MMSSETELTHSATGQQHTSQRVDDAGPLSRSDEDVLIQGIQRAKMIDAAGRLAFVNFLLCAGFACLSLLYTVYYSLTAGQFNLTGLVMSLGIATVAVIELRGKILLGRLNTQAPVLLGWNQFGFMCLLVGYGIWALYCGFTGPNLATETGLFTADYHDVAGPLYLVVISIMFGSLIVLSLVFQGMNSVYYFGRRKPMQAFLDETPQWVLDFIRRMKSNAVR
jgi:hypothetical protein